MITEYIDFAQIALYVFWIFFAGLIYYLRQEDKREGYPMESRRTIKVQGWPPMPPEKYFFRPTPAGAAPASDNREDNA